MASNLLELRKAAGYRSASDFAEAHGIPASTYARYESNPGKIPLERAWELADALGTTIDAVVGRTVPDPSSARGEVQLEYDALCPEARALADELREFVRTKDERIRAAGRRGEERRYEALCYQYERQMLEELRDGAGFGELVSFESADEARAAFESFLREQAAMRRGGPAAGALEAADERTIEGIMAAYDRTHGELDACGLHVLWSTVDYGLSAGHGSAAGAGGGDAGA